MVSFSLPPSLFIHHAYSAAIEMKYTHIRTGNTIPRDRMYSAAVANIPAMRIIAREADNVRFRPYMTAIDLSPRRVSSSIWCTCIMMYTEFLKKKAVAAPQRISGRNKLPPSEEAARIVVAPSKPLRKTAAYPLDLNRNILWE